MRVAIKICCIADADEARLALAAGADALGLVSAMPSGPGVIAEERIAEVAHFVRAYAVGSGASARAADTTNSADASDAAAVAGAAPRTFLLTARTRADDIAEQHARCGTTTLQLVDRVVPAELQRLRKLCPGVELVQVIHVVGDASLDEARAAAPWVDAVLLDSGNPALAVKELGGTGRTHDWALSRRIRQALQPLPVWLAGGLNAGNAAEAVARVAPHGLDLCNGVRTAGRLDAAKLAAFVAAARGSSVMA